MSLLFLPDELSPRQPLPYASSCAAFLRLLAGRVPLRRLGEPRLPRPSAARPPRRAARPGPGAPAPAAPADGGGFVSKRAPLPAQPGQRADAARLCSVLLIGFTRRRGKRKKGTQDRQTCSLPVNNEIEGGCCCCSNPLNTGPCFSQAMHFGIRRRMHAVAAWI